MRWSTAALVIGKLKKDAHKGKKVEERGRQHVMTKMRGNLKLRRVWVCDWRVWLDVCGWENRRKKKKKKRRRREPACEEKRNNIKY